MKKYLLAVSVIALVAAGHAQAADVVSYDPPEVAPVAVQAFSWEGFYVGGQLGGSWADSDVSSRMEAGTFLLPPMTTPLPLSSGRLLDFSPDPSGFIGGIYAGYNFDIGNDVIVGLETDFVWGDVNERTGYKSFDLKTLGGSDYMVARVGIEQKWAGATRVRVGYAMDRWLPYVAAGVAYGKIKSSANAYLSATPGGPPLPPPVPVGLEYNFRNSDTFVGWTIGTGAEYAMTDNMLLRLEYRYSDYGDKTYRHVIPGGGTAAISYKVDHQAHDLRVGVAYKF